MSSFVVIGDDWSRHVSTIQHLFSRICLDHDVIWVNSFGLRRPELTLYDLRRAVDKTMQMVLGSRSRGPATRGGAPSRIVAPRILPWHDVSTIRKLNAWSLRHDILRASRCLRSDPIFVSATPLAADLVGHLGERQAVYFCMDDYGELPGADKDLIELYERDMLDRVNCVVATASALVASKQPRSGRAFHLPQGVNYEHFATPQRVPVEMGQFSRPIVGFAGGVMGFSGDCVDYGLLTRRLSNVIPAGSIVLVGPITNPSGHPVKPPALPGDTYWGRSQIQKRNANSRVSPTSICWAPGRTASYPVTSRRLMLALFRMF